MEVEQNDGKEVVISIGNIKNKLSGSNAPYPNENDHFQFILAKQPGSMPEVKATGGRYSVSGIKIQTMDWEKLKPMQTVKKVQNWAFIRTKLWTT